jgi:hypothetical protein
VTIKEQRIRCRIDSISKSVSDIVFHLKMAHRGQNMLWIEWNKVTRVSVAIADNLESVKKSVYFHCHTLGRKARERVNYMKKYRIWFNSDYSIGYCPLANFCNHRVSETASVSIIHHPVKGEMVGNIPTLLGPLNQLYGAKHNLKATSCVATQ